MTPPELKNEGKKVTEQNFLLLCTWSAFLHFVLLITKKNKKIKNHNTFYFTTQRNGISFFFFPSGQVKGGMCSCAASDSLTLLLTLRKRLSVNQIRAASQTSPGVRCYRASPTMLHCSLHTAYPPQRSGGFQ